MNSSVGGESATDMDDTDAKSLLVFVGFARQPDEAFYLPAP